jgi:hypothetical protein
MGINQVWKARLNRHHNHITLLEFRIGKKRQKANLITVGFVANFSKVDSAANATSKPL